MRLYLYLLCSKTQQQPAKRRNRVTADLVHIVFFVFLNVRAPAHYLR